MKVKIVQNYVTKAVDPDLLTTPFVPEFFKEFGAILYQFVPTIKGEDLLPGEVRYGYKFYLLNKPDKEGVFYLSTHRDMDILKSRSKFLKRVGKEIEKLK